VLQLVHANHDEAERGHKRLRTDVDGIGKKVAGMEAVQTDLLLRVQKLELAPVNVEKVAFSSVQLIAIVVASLGLAAGIWQLHVGINDVQVSIVNSAKLQDERNETLKEELKQQKAALEMRRVEIQNLSNLVQQRLGGR
jgi:hypothetical protein